MDGKKAIFLLSSGLDTISKHSYPETLKKAESVGHHDLFRLHGSDWRGCITKAGCRPRNAASRSFRPTTSCGRLPEATVAWASSRDLQVSIRGIYETVERAPAKSVQHGLRP